MGKAQRTRGVLQDAGADAAAFGEFYARYVRRVLVYFTTRVWDPEVAADLTAETFAQVLGKLARYTADSAESEQAWLFAFAEKELLHYLRRGKVEQKALKRLQVTLQSFDDDALEQILNLDEVAQARPRIQHAVASLPVAQREAIQLRVIDELAYAEVAQRVGETEAVVRKRVSRGLTELGRLLDHEAWQPA